MINQVACGCKSTLKRAIENSRETSCEQPGEDSVRTSQVFCQLPTLMSYQTIQPDTAQHVPVLSLFKHLLSMATARGTSHPRAASAAAHVESLTGNSSLVLLTSSCSSQSAWPDQPSLRLSCDSERTNSSASAASARLDISLPPTEAMRNSLSHRSAQSGFLETDSVTIDPNVTSDDRNLSSTRSLLATQSQHLTQPDPEDHGNSDILTLSSAECLSVINRPVGNSNWESCDDVCNSEISEDDSDCADKKSDGLMVSYSHKGTGSRGSCCQARPTQQVTRPHLRIADIGNNDDDSELELQVPTEKFSELSVHCAQSVESQLPFSESLCCFLTQNTFDKGRKSRKPGAQEATRNDSCGHQLLQYPESEELFSEPHTSGVQQDGANRTGFQPVDTTSRTTLSDSEDLDLFLDPLQTANTFAEPTNTVHHQVEPPVSESFARNQEAFMVSIGDTNRSKIIDVILEADLRHQELSEARSSVVIVSNNEKSAGDFSCDLFSSSESECSRDDPAGISSECIPDTQTFKENKSNVFSRIFGKSAESGEVGSCSEASKLSGSPVLGSPDAIFSQSLVFSPSPKLLGHNGSEKKTLYQSTPVSHSPSLHPHRKLRFPFDLTLPENEVFENALEESCGDLFSGGSCDLFSPSDRADRSESAAAQLPDSGGARTRFKRSLLSRFAGERSDSSADLFSSSSAE